jgi:uroporphyrinogen-III synthase
MNGDPNKPLIGWRILTTRASKQSGGLAKPLRELGAEVTEVPTIEIKPPSSFKALDAGLKNISEYDWLILTSVNGVEAMADRMKKLKIPVSKLKHLQIAAIGPATTKAIEDRRLKVTVTPEKYVAESVVEALRGKTEGKRVLLVRAKVARDVLPNELRKAGAKIDIAEAYETKIPAGAKVKIQKLFKDDTQLPDIVTFTSSSTATNFLDLLGKKYEPTLRAIWLASIGPVTSKTLTDAGFPPAIEAHEYTMPGLVFAITEHVHKMASQELLKRLLGVT